VSGVILATDSDYFPIQHSINMYIFLMEAMMQKLHFLYYLGELHASDGGNKS
jgi:hypothetical protein